LRPIDVYNHFQDCGRGPWSETVNHLFTEDQRIRVLDLFSAAAGGWSLGMHRAGYRTIAACEVIDWRRALYSENNPGVPVYDDVTTLTADRLIRDGVGLPDIIVGSPPCQDISSANTKGKGVDGERSGLYFEAVRLIDECRPRWFALENSANLRTRGADRVIDALAAIGYTCWPFVVSAGDIGANHERKRSWLIGCDVSQIADAGISIAERGIALGGRGWRQEGIKGQWSLGCGLREAETTYTDGIGRDEGRSRRWSGVNISVPEDIGDSAEVGCGTGLPGRRAGATSGTEQPARRDEIGPGHVCEHGIRWPWACDECDQASYPGKERPEDGTVVGGLCPSSIAEAGRADGRSVETRDLADPDQAGQAGQADGYMVPGVQQAEISDDGCGAGRSDDGPSIGQMAVRQTDRRGALRGRSDWSLDDLADRIRVDDELPAWVAQSRIDVGGKRGTSAASLLVEAFGDAVVPQIPEAIGRAILRVERALAAVSAANDNHQSIPAARKVSHA
jgi:DNA (cytosine-5)-methyltransferase 1